MEYIARTSKMLLHVERFQEKKCHTFDILLRLLNHWVLCIIVVVSVCLYYIFSRNLA